MATAAGLLAHLLSFVVVVATVATPSVSFLAWLALYGLGAAYLLIGPYVPIPKLSARQWAKLFVYALILAVIFAGAEFGLQTLGNSVKPRGVLPSYLGGLEPYFMLVPGVASVALGELARKAVAHFRPAGKVGPRL